MTIRLNTGPLCGGALRTALCFAIVGIVSSPAFGQLQFHSFLSFPVVSAQGDNLPDPQWTWMTGPQSLEFSATAMPSTGGFWSYDSTGVNRIVRSFDALPGAPSGATVLTTQPAWVGPNSDLWFLGHTGTVDQMWRRTPSGITSILTVGHAAPAVPGTVVALSGGVPFVAADGTGYVHANVQSTGTTNVLWRIQGSAYQPIAQTGQNVPGLNQPLTSAQIARILPDGRVVLRADTSSATTVSILPGDGVSTLASAGTITALNGYSPVAVSPGGAMLLNNASTSLSTRDKNGQITEIVHSGGPIAGNPGWTLAPGPFQGLSVSDNTNSVIAGRMGPSGDVRQTVAIGTSGGLIPILRDASSLVGGTFEINTAFRVTDFNSRGEVAIQGTLLIGGVGTPAVYAWDPMLGPMRVAVPGDQISVDGILRTVAAAQLLQPTADGAGGAANLADTGNLTFLASFVGGSSAVIMTTIPSPSGLVSFVLPGVVWATRRRRRVGRQEAPTTTQVPLPTRRVGRRGD